MAILSIIKFKDSIFYKLGLFLMALFFIPSFSTALTLVDSYSGEEVVAESQDTSSSTVLTMLRTSSTSSGGGSVSAGYLTGMNQTAFAHGEVDVKSGALQLTIPEVNLPGKHGLNLNISRTYSSRAYLSSPNPDTSFGKSWGCGAGQGWSFSFGQRAFFIDIGDRLIDKVDADAKDIVVIESGPVAGSYTYDPATSFYKSDVTGNYNIVEKVTDGITVRVPGGLKYYFNKKYYSELHRQWFEGFLMSVTGYYLTEIENIFGEKIKFSYEPLTQYDNDPDEKEFHWTELGNLIIEEAALLNNSAGAVYKLAQQFYQMVYFDHKYDDGADNVYLTTGIRIDTDFTYQRVNKITDTYDREINLYYLDELNRIENPGSAHQYLGKIELPGQADIEYFYNNDGTLNSYKVGDMPAVSYDYSQYIPDYQVYKKHYSGSQQLLGTDVKGGLPKDYLLVGFGGRVDENSKVTTLHLYGRKINNNGFLDSVETFKFGDEPDCALESSIQLDGNYAIVGLGGEIEDNDLSDLIVYYRAFDPVNRKLTGDILTKTVLGTTEEASYHPGDPDSFIDDITIISGLGLRGNASNLKTLYAYTSLLDQKYSDQQGQLLESITSPTKVMTSFSYDEIFTTQKQSDHIQDTKACLSDNFIANATHPIVIQKTIKDSSQSYAYTFDYARDNNDEPSKNVYELPNDAGKAYCFANVRVSLPSISKGDVSVSPDDIFYTFEQGKLQSQTQGEQSTTNDWDHVNNRLKYVIAKDPDKEIKTSYLKYDNYSQPLLIKIQYEKDGIYVVDKFLETKYKTDSKYIDKGLLGLVDYSRIKKTQDSTTYFKDQTITYNDYGQPTEIFENSERKQKIEYDADHRVYKKYTGNLDGYKEYTYSEDIDLTVTEKLFKTSISELYSIIKVYDGDTGWLKSVTDPNSQTTTYEYDDYGRPELITPPSDAGTPETDYIYPELSAFDALNKVTITTGERTVIQYKDEYGRVIKVDNPAGEDDIVTSYFFAKYPLAIYKNSILAANKLKSYVYDNKFRVTSVTTPLGITSYVFHDGERQVTITDKGLATTKTVDELGRLKSEVTASSYETKFEEYNILGIPERTIDTRGLYHHFDVDVFGRKTDTYDTNMGSDSLQKYATTKYFSKDSPYVGLINTLTIYKDSESQDSLYTYTYDSLGRMKTNVYTGPYGSETESYVYDEGNGVGQLTSVENDTYKEKMSFDDYGRFDNTERTYKFTNTNKSYTYDVNYSISYDGLIDEITYNSDDYKLTYVYDSDDLKNRRVSSITNLIDDFTYNTNATIQQIKLANQTTISYEYQNDVQVTKITAKKSDGTTLFQANYGYDGQGNIASKNITDLFNPGNNYAVTYNYGSINELIGVEKEGVNNFYKFDYDKNGNRKYFKNPANPTAESNENQIDNDKDLLKTRFFANGTINYDYDMEGNLTSKKYLFISSSTVAESEVAYTYNYQGCLTQVHKDGVLIAEYKYDTNRQLIYSKVSEDSDYEEKIYHWDNEGRIIGEGVIKDGSVLKDFVTKYYYSGNEKIAMDQWNGSDWERYYFINNLQGSTVLIIDNNEHIVQRTQLDPYGNIERSVGIFDKEINYTGKKFEPVTGFFYFNQRWYDPEIGRFLTEDPAGQCFNPYIYCANNPLMYVDPDGEWFFLFIGAAIGAYIGGNGKDLTSLQTWGDIALGAAVGGILGGGADLLLAGGHIGTIRLGVFEPNIAGSGVDGFVGLTQTAKGFSASADLLGGGASLLGLSYMFMETPLFNELNNPKGKYSGDENYPVAVEKSLAGDAFDTAVIDPNAVHTQLIEPNKSSWSFGPQNTLNNPNSLMQQENLKGYKNRNIIYHFRNISKYNQAKRIVQKRYRNKSYNFFDLKCHDPVRDMIDVYESL